MAAAIDSPVIRDRRDFGALCNYHEVRQAFEVGVDMGVFADQFLTQWRGNMLTLIDPWEPYAEMVWSREPAMMMAVHVLGKHAGRVRLVRGRSPDVIPELAFLNNCRSFVYIDGAHDYESVRRDIAAWWKAVEPGSIVAGHDYNIATPGVIRAVDDFSANVERTVYKTMEADQAASWYFFK